MDIILLICVFILVTTFLVSLTICLLYLTKCIWKFSASHIPVVLLLLIISTTILALIPPGYAVKLKAQKLESCHQLIEEAK